MISHIRHSPIKLPEPCVVHPVEYWSGKQLISIIFPPEVDYGGVTEASDLAEMGSKVYVHRGELLCGMLRKATLGTSAGSFVDILYREYGCVITAQWMSDIQRLVNAWLCTRGFAVGVSDCVLGEKGEARVYAGLKQTMQVALELTDEPVSSGTEEAMILESTVVRILSRCLMTTGGIVDDELGHENAIRKMVQAGSKGNPINLSQICGCVGQQSVEGRRVFAEKGGRTLSCFQHDEKNLAGQGFVENSYALGLSPHEYFFHAMGGREGLVDTAVKTATTGYIQRRQMKSMEDHRVCYDGTVRNAEQSIIDFSYGGDGMDPTRVERIAIRMLTETEDSLALRLTPWEYAQALVCRREILKCKTIIPIDPRILLPFSPKRLLGSRKRATSEVDGDLEAIVQQVVDEAPSLSVRAAILDFFNANEFTARSFTAASADALFQSVSCSSNGASTRRDGRFHCRAVGGRAHK